MSQCLSAWTVTARLLPPLSEWKVFLGRTIYTHRCIPSTWHRAWHTVNTGKTTLRLLCPAVPKRQAVQSRMRNIKAVSWASLKASYSNSLRLSCFYLFYKMMVIGYFKILLVYEIQKSRSCQPGQYLPGFGSKATGDLFSGPCCQLHPATCLSWSYLKSDLLTKVVPRDFPQQDGGIQFISPAEWGDAIQFWL